MKQLKLIFMSILIVALLSFGVRAQVATAGMSRFGKGDLSFNYPANWKLTDSSTADMQSVTIVPKGGGSEISVIVQPGINASCAFQVENRRIMHGLVRKLATRIQTATPLQTSSVKMGLGKLDVDGTQVQGKMNGKPVTGEVYSLRLNRHFLSLVYLRADNDQSTISAWALILQTLVLGGGVLAAGPTVEGTAIRLVQPPYPAIAKKAHASGKILIHVLIDEGGNVIAADAIEGNPLLQPAAIAAARASKFRPTKICGEPVKVNGVVQYNFDLP